MPYVDLSRRFRDLNQDELASPELLASLNDQRLSAWGLKDLSADGWPELLQHPRVILLAEAGSGKTAEMREQAKRLLAVGTPAFFVALESLRHESLRDLLSPADERALNAWKESQSVAWFFLDAVDELKLTQGKLERALGRLAKEIDGLLHRAHIIISCRPHDWRPSSDLATVQEKLPCEPPVELPNPDEVFLAALRDREGHPRRDYKKLATPGEPRVVVLLPLSDRQIETLARSLGVQDPDALIAEIRRRDAWNFARRPLDLMELITSWKANGRLGTRSDQHFLNVTIKLKDPDRVDRGLLSDERARIGAERLALALALTHTRTIRSPEQALSSDRAEGVLDAAEILVDWSEEERQTLLRRALFDPATYGRIRFHHRSVQEYLAARRLFYLRDIGMPTKTLRSLLFAERYGEQLVIPSMQAIAAWLALWNDEVRRELKAREPETLLSMGDPESLPITERANLLRAFARSYGEGGWRGIDIPLDEIARLAHPELASVVRVLWNAKPTSPDVSILLLEMIWQGPIEACADIARSAVFDSNLPESHRMTALKALLACNKPDVLRDITDSILHEPDKWPHNMVQAAAHDLFPSALSVAELMALVQRSAEAKAQVRRWSWTMREIVARIPPLSDPADELREALTSLIWLGRDQDHEWYPLRGLFDHLAAPLADLCSRQLEFPESSLDSRLVLSSIIANRFRREDAGEGGELRKHFVSNPVLREAAFWGELEILAKTLKIEDSGEKYFQIEHGGLIQQIAVDDRQWLLRALQNSDDTRRSVAFHALLSLWYRSGHPESQWTDLVAAVREDPVLTEQLQRKSTVDPYPEIDKWNREQHERELERADKERQLLEGWSSWRNQLVQNPDAAFAAEELTNTTGNLHYWLDANRDEVTSFNVWNANALRAAFGNAIAERAEEAFKEVWRTNVPTLWSQRPAEERNKVLLVWSEGLTGLAAESAVSSWATRLSPDEARIAAVYGTIELNGFTTWLRDLAAAQPIIVEEVIGGELSAELAAAEEHSHLPTLQNLAHADENIKRLLAPRLLSALPTWPSTFRDEECSRRLAHHLNYVISILRNVVVGQDRAAASSVCSSGYSADSTSPLALIWLRGLFLFDPEEATQVLQSSLESWPGQELVDRAIATFASLFGDRGPALAFADDKTRAESLGRLIRCAYRYVRHSEDQEHEGPYTPNLRDRAETGREFLLGALLETPGAEAQDTIRDLALDTTFAHYPDRLRLLARRRAASDAESAALRPEEVVALEKRFETPPHDRDSLFAIMVGRLEDIAHDIQHDDFSERCTLRKISEESEMQHVLARWLRDIAKGAYIVAREEEVADQKRTDIRLLAERCGQKAVIEVKIADKWSLADLEQALRGQLLGQYLRHERCRAGCLLLTYHGKKTCWRHPQKGRRLTFQELIEHLGSQTRSIEDETIHAVRLTVCPLDLTGSPVNS